MELVNLSGTKRTCKRFKKVHGKYRCADYRKGRGMPPTPTGVCRHPTGPIQRKHGRCATRRKHRR